ncbi:MAG: glycosyltransferase family 39 protein [Phycisphaerae bacterium]|nr:glycosyltransferase family 39 protein [Phycisphaerae bacterium]
MTHATEPDQPKPSQEATSAPKPAKPPADATDDALLASPERFDRADRMMMAGLMILGAVLLLPNLGDRCLWQDEAECALVAKGVLRTGLPIAWDGRCFVTGAYGVELNDSFLWAWTPWAMHYLAALGMLILGPTSLGARLPFALLGCVSIGLTYLVARRLLRDRWASCLSAVLLLTSVQYMLLMRQCRYYAILPVAALLAIWGYADLPRRRGTIVLILGMVLLFHANYVTFACVAVGMAAHAAIWRRRRDTWLRLILAALVTAALTLPWFFGMGLHHALGTSQTVGYQHQTAGHSFLKLLFVMNQFVCPAVVALALAAAAILGRLRVRGAYALVLCMAVPVMILIPVFLWAGPRYLVHMLPLGSIVVAAALREIYLRNDVAGNIGAVVAGVTNLLPAVACALFPAAVGANQLDGDYATGPATLRQAMLKSEWAGYVNELRQPFYGPNEAITRALSDSADPNAVVYAPYGQLPIMFHTGRPCAGMLKPDSRRRPGWDRLPDYLFDPDLADWYVIRPAWKPKEGYQALIHRWQQRAQRSGRRLTVHPLQVTDIGWGNRPLLRYHYFESPGPSGTRDVSLIESTRINAPATSSRNVPSGG